MNDVITAALDLLRIFLTVGFLVVLTVPLAKFISIVEPESAAEDVYNWLTSTLNKIPWFPVLFITLAITGFISLL